MMFILSVPEETWQPPKKRANKILTEAEYFSRDTEKLKGILCPTCGDAALFRGCVFIGCRACMNYFSEDEIIIKNIG